MDFKRFYEGYHHDRKLPKRIIGKKNFTYRTIIGVLDKYCKSKDVLDVGSGVGTVDFYLAKKGKRVTGIEISQKAFDVAQKSIGILGLEKYVEFKRADFYRFRTRKTFDFILCCAVLEHLPDDKKALRKMNKLLRRSGRLMIAIPSTNAALNKFNSSIEEFDRKSGHLRRYTMESAKAALKEASFRTIYTKKTDGLVKDSLFVYPWGNNINRVANRFPLVSDFITFLDELSLNMFGESLLILVAEKV